MPSVLDDLLDVLLNPLAFDADAAFEAALEELLDEAFDAVDLEAAAEEASLGASLTSEGSMCAGGGSARAVLAIEGIGSVGRGTIWETLVGGGVDRGVPSDLRNMLRLASLAPLALLAALDPLEREAVGARERMAVTLLPACGLDGDDRLPLRLPLLEEELDFLLELLSLRDALTSAAAAVASGSMMGEGSEDPMSCFTLGPVAAVAEPASAPAAAVEGPGSPLGAWYS